MDFERLIDSCKFLFHWKDERDLVDLEIAAIHRDSLQFINSFPLPGGACPAVTVSLKVKNTWHEHYFDKAEWIVGSNGQIDGLRLIGPDSALREWKKNLELGLCV